MAAGFKIIYLYLFIPQCSYCPSQLHVVRLLSDSSRLLICQYRNQVRFTFSCVSIFTDVTSVAVLTGMPAHSLTTKTPTQSASTTALCVSRPTPTCSHSKTTVVFILRHADTAAPNAARPSVYHPNCRITAVCTRRNGSLPALCARGAFPPRLASSSTWKCSTAVHPKQLNSLGFRPAALIWVGALGLTLR